MACGPHQLSGDAGAAVVDLLLDAGAFVNAQDKEGWTALSRACRYGHSQIVAALVNRGADIHIKDNARHTSHRTSHRTPLLSPLTHSLTIDRSCLMSHVSCLISHVIHRRVQQRTIML